MAEDLDTLTKSRKYVRQRITKFCQKVNTRYPNLDSQQRGIYLETLLSLKNELSDLNKSIFPLYLKAQLAEAEIDRRVAEEESYDDKLLESLARLRTPQSVPPVAATPQPSGESNSNDANLTGRNLKLPRIPLPEFSNNKNENYQKFIRSFEYAVARHNLGEYEKFMYLRGQLSGGPKSLIDSLDVGQQTYTIAKDLLEKAFDRKVNSKQDYIKNLCELKLNKNSDVYSFIGEMRTVLAGFESLGVTIDDVLQYFIWNSFDDSFQAHLTNITNKNKPSLAEIKDNLFEASDRYTKQINLEETKGKNKFKPEFKPTSSLAVNIEHSKGKGKICMLCHKDGRNKDHDMRNCPVYDSAIKRVNKLKSLKACTKCSFINHDTRQCKFKFSSMCRKCGQAHMSFLCVNNSSQSVANTTQSNTSPNQVSASAVVAESYSDNCNYLSLVEVHQSSAEDAIILPTATAYLVSNQNCKMKTRMFIDGGSQKNFINRTLVEKLKFPIVKPNISLRIHGFNSSRNLITDVVKVTVQLGDQIFEINAICIDKIETKFVAGNINRIAESFVNKGFTMADTELINCNGLVNY